MFEQDVSKVHYRYPDGTERVVFFTEKQTTPRLPTFRYPGSFIIDVPYNPFVTLWVKEK